MKISKYEISEFNKHGFLFSVDPGIGGSAGKTGFDDLPGNGSPELSKDEAG